MGGGHCRGSFTNEGAITSIHALIMITVTVTVTVAIAVMINMIIFIAPIATAVTIIS